MLLQNKLKRLIIIFIYFTIKINCNIIYQNKNFNVNNIETKISCPGNYYITCVNGCALENRDKIKICSIGNPNLCIKKKGSSRDIEFTTNSGEYNKFMFDYVGHDAFKLFSENSRDYIADHFGSLAMENR